MAFEMSSFVLGLISMLLILPMSGGSHWFGRTRANNNQLYQQPSALKAELSSPEGCNVHLNAHESEEKFEDLLDSLFRGQFSREERLALEHATGTLQTYEMKGNGCFKAAAISIKTGCKELYLTDIDKIRYAVQFTKCEIATANIPIPPECQTESTNADIYSCVEVLSHIPQLWTSYSGYVREVVNMCFALRYEAHRDHVERLFENVTAYQISNYRLLRQQRRELAAWHSAEMSRLSNIEDIQQQIISHTKDIEQATAHTSSVTSSLDHKLAAAAQTLETILTGHSEARGIVENILSETQELSDTMRENLSDTVEALAGLQENLSRVANGVTDLTDHETRALQKMESMQERMGHLLEDMFTQSSSLSQELQRVDDRVALADGRLQAFATDSEETLRGMMMTVNTIYTHQLEKLAASLQALQELNQTTRYNMNMQDTMNESLKVLQMAHQALVEQWDISFARAEENLESLSVRSTQQIQLLVEAAEIATSRHAEVVGLVMSATRFVTMIFDELRTASILGLLYVTSVSTVALSSASQKMRPIRHSLRIGSLASCGITVTLVRYFGRHMGILCGFVIQLSLLAANIVRLSWGARRKNGIAETSTSQNHPIHDSYASSSYALSSDFIVRNEELRQRQGNALVYDHVQQRRTALYAASSKPFPRFARLC